MNKKILSSILMVCVLLSSIAFAYAESNNFSIKNISSSRWQQTYSAYGRTINVDAEVTAPQLDYAPIIKVERWLPVKEENYEKWNNYFKAPNENTKNGYHFNVVEDQGTTAFSYNEFNVNPFIGKATRKIISNPKADWKTTFAENNPMSMWEGFEFVEEKLNEVCESEIDLFPLFGGRKSILRESKSGKPLREMGDYNYCLSQRFYGIPLLVGISDTYVDLNVQAIGGIHTIFPDISAEIYGKNSYYICATLVTPTEIVRNDVPVRPFEYSKGEIEDLIYKGLVRDVYNVRLGYVMFHNEDDLKKSFYLVPSWVVDCEFYKTADGEKYEGGWPEMFWHCSEFHQLIINAQTGKLYDPFSTQEDRNLVPQTVYEAAHDE